MEWARKMQLLGAGEILLTSMDGDGTKAGSVFVLGQEPQPASVRTTNGAAVMVVQTILQRVDLRDGEVVLGLYAYVPRCHRPCLPAR